ncbi:MAG TPA: hydantoinase/oxoprolinase family protein [Pseudolabrys sp.]|nr:hydantoinase/oxoprolinase family protein [Pseudolabrys sp.]
MLQVNRDRQRFALGIDVGGTFTDLVLIGMDDGAMVLHKTPSTPHDPSEAMERGISEILSLAAARPPDVGYFGHGTTVATNALIEGKIAPTALVTTKGFRDILEIRRQRQPHNYNIRLPKPAAPIPRHLRRELAERTFLLGREDIAPSREELMRHVAEFEAANVAAVAVVFLHSYRNPEHEKAVVDWLRQALPGKFVCASHEVLAEFREYERTSTTVFNAGLGPVMSRYLDRLEARVKELGLGAAPHIQQSNGGFASPQEAGQRPIGTLVSGPAAGVTGAVHVTKAAGFRDIITFDVGGTSTDVCLIENATPLIARERDVAGYPVRFPMIDVHSVGAGGGSIAWIDDGGFLQVGPKSAGADPGPVCYGRGGTEPTVTDANVLLGRLSPGGLLGGRMPIRPDLARKAIEEKIAQPLGLSVEDAAEGILTILNETMVRAIRVITVERGYDPRKFALLAFGGAGPLLATPLARELGMNTILVPPGPGLLCALGLLVADARRDFSRTHIARLSEDASGLAELARDLGGQIEAWFAAQTVTSAARAVDWAADLRYVGQSHELTLPITGTPSDAGVVEQLAAAFNAEHTRLYGYAADAPIELVTLRATARLATARPPIRVDKIAAKSKVPPRAYREVHFPGIGMVKTAVYDRDAIAEGATLAGPLIIEQMDTTTVVFPGQRVERDAFDNLILRST